MATVTKSLGSFDNGNVRFEIDYSDTLLRLLAVRCINNSTIPASATVTAVSQPTRTYTRTFAASQTTVLNIPTTAATRLNITVDARGRVDGVDYQLAWPAV